MRCRSMTSLAVGMIGVLIAACDPVAMPSASPFTPTANGSPGPTLAASPSDSAARSAVPTDNGPGRALAALQWRKASIQIERTSILFDVAATAVGWVAIGTRLNLPSADASFAPGDNPLDHLNSGVIWTSADGLAWTQLPDAPEFDGSMIVRVLRHGDESRSWKDHPGLLGNARGGANGSDPAGHPAPSPSHAGDRATVTTGRPARSRVSAASPSRPLGGIP